MVAVVKKKIKEHMSLKEIKDEIKKRKIDASIMRRLIFIKAMFENEDVQIASKIVGIAPATGYEWLKRWNDEGIEGLTPKFAGGKPSKLSEDDFKILNKIFENTPNLTTDIAQEIIKVNFKIKYSERQVQRILRKLNYTYIKPYMIYAKMPDDAEDQLQKKLAK